MFELLSLSFCWYRQTSIEWFNFPILSLINRCSSIKGFKASWNVELELLCCRECFSVELWLIPALLVSLSWDRCFLFSISRLLLCLLLMLETRSFAGWKLFSWKFKHILGEYLPFLHPELKQYSASWSLEFCALSLYKLCSHFHTGTGHCDHPRVSHPHACSCTWEHPEVSRLYWRWFPPTQNVWWPTLCRFLFVPCVLLFELLQVLSFPQWPQFDLHQLLLYYKIIKTIITFQKQICW